MAAIAFVGDGVTTTTLAVAASWPLPDPTTSDGRQVVVVEADPAGGSVAAWLDAPISPSLSGAVTALHHARATGASSAAMWSSLTPFIRRSSAGPRFLAAPLRSREARRAVSEAAHTLFPLLLATDDVVALLDVGRLDPCSLPPTLRSTTHVVVVHRQESASAAAEAARLERLAESMEALAGAGHRTILVVIGDAPFDVGEIVDFAAPGTTAATLPVDPLAAAVLAGRSGVSERRLQRLPLMRAAADLARTLDASVSHAAVAGSEVMS